MAWKKLAMDGFTETTLYPWPILGCLEDNNCDSSALEFEKISSNVIVGKYF